MQISSISLRQNFREGLSAFSRDIKLSHSIFALPFVGVALAISDFQGVSWHQIILIVMCMVFARSFAMGMNRFLDRDFDRKNIRTSTRVIPSGLVSIKMYLFITLAFGFAFIVTSSLLSSLAGYLSPLLMIVLMSYSFMKRLSWLTHWYLGLCLGLAPIAARIALFGDVTAPVLLVGCAVAFWTAGFDLLYALQDREFDRENGLHSVPSKLGFRAAIWMSRASFLFMMVFLALAGFAHSAGVWWYVGVILVALILATEHWIIRGAMRVGTSDKINLAFFNLNALVSVLFFLFVVVDVYAKS